MDVEVVRVSSKGQVVLPLSMRKHFRMRKGEKLMAVEDRGLIVLRPIKQMTRDVDEEIYMMGRAAKGWAEIKKGKAHTMSKAEFLKELSTW